MRQVMVRGLKKVDQMSVLSMAAYNLVRMRSLGQIRPPAIAVVAVMTPETGAKTRQESMQRRPASGL